MFVGIKRLRKILIFRSLFIVFYKASWCLNNRLFIYLLYQTFFLNYKNITLVTCTLYYTFFYYFCQHVFIYINSVKTPLFRFMSQSTNFFDRNFKNCQYFTSVFVGSLKVFYRIIFTNIFLTNQGH